VQGRPAYSVARSPGSLPAGSKCGVAPLTCWGSLETQWGKPLSVRLAQQNQRCGTCGAVLVGCQVWWGQTDSWWWCWCCQRPRSEELKWPSEWCAHCVTTSLWSGQGRRKLHPPGYQWCHLGNTCLMGSKQPLPQPQESFALCPPQCAASSLPKLAVVGHRSRHWLHPVPKASKHACFHAADTL